MAENLTWKQHRNRRIRLAREAATERMRAAGLVPRDGRLRASRVKVTRLAPPAPQCAKVTASDPKENHR